MIEYQYRTLIYLVGDVMPTCIGEYCLSNMQIEMASKGYGVFIRIPESESPLALSIKRGIAKANANLLWLWKKEQYEKGRNDVHYRY